MEATGYRGKREWSSWRTILTLDWTKRVLARLQGAALDAGFFASGCRRTFTGYHLDDNP